MKTIDFHTHILPGADHGSDSLATSLSQIELAKSACVDVLIATSHFYPHRHRINDFLKKRDKAYNELTQNTDIEIIAGAEVLLCEGLNKLEGLEKLTIGDSNVILLELPDSTFKPEYESCVEDIISSGYRIVLAHADRYPEENIERLVSIGAKIQLNASALSGFLTKKHITKWIERGLVVALGSDIHMADKKAYASFVKAKKKLGSYFDSIMQKTNQILSK